MAHLTITVDDAVLKRARIRALTRDESLNAYLAEVLRRYADGDEPQPAVEDFLATARASRYGSGPGGRAWTRDELHRV